MTRFQGALLVAAVCLLSAAPATGQIVGHPFEISGRVGYFKSDDRARRQDAPEFGGAFGWRANPFLSVEAQGFFAPSKADSAPEQNYNFSALGLDLRWNLTPPENRVVPFVTTGVGWAFSNTTAPGSKDEVDGGQASLGIGALWNIVNQRTYLRAQARATFFRERGLIPDSPLEVSTHPSFTIGLQYNWGGEEKDTDLDGVRDWLDRCANTPLGATVDEHGCPLDTDGDGVYDGLDQCPGTIAGCVVDSLGCAVDSDNDGVCDGLDQCPDTPAGAAVDEVGCPSDSDGDGVLDGIDQCPDSPQGCTVDEVGCTLDTDGDGVCDGIDQCPNTPEGTPVNSQGCPMEVGELERTLISMGFLRLDNVGFASARGDLQDNIIPTLDELGKILPQYPNVRFELVGFTDDRGDSAAAERMSLARGRAVQRYLVQQHGISTDQLTSRGGGGAGSGTAARYVELRVVNPEALAGELDKRVPDPEPAAPSGETDAGSDAAPDDSGGGDGSDDS